MRIILFGTGAMASIFAVRLSRVTSVTLLGTWSEAIGAIGDRGILLEDSQESQQVRVKADYLGTSQEPADIVIVLVKSWQTAGVAAYLPSYLNPGGVAISLQNGIGNRWAGEPIRGALQKARRCSVRDMCGRAARARLICWRRNGLSISSGVQDLKVTAAVPKKHRVCCGESCA